MGFELTTLVVIDPECTGSLSVFGILSMWIIHRGFNYRFDILFVGMQIATLNKHILLFTKTKGAGTC